MVVERSPGDWGEGTDRNQMLGGNRGLITDAIIFEVRHRIMVAYDYQKGKGPVRGSR